jgi:hypothetical protein
MTLFAIPLAREGNGVVGKNAAGDLPARHCETRIRLTPRQSVRGTLISLWPLVVGCVVFLFLWSKLPDPKDQDQDK